MFDTGLADRIRAKDVRVVEVAGWPTRGSSTYNPQGAVDHHTAGAATGTVPSFGTIINGRPGIPGPLAQVLQSREPDGRDIAYVIAAGRANHAGAGGWNGLVGNSTVGGLEVEHTGLFPLPEHRIEIATRITAALLEAPGSTWDAGFSCQHFEWAPSRKIDIATHMNPHAFRQRVAFWIGRTQEQDMPLDVNDINQIKGAMLDVLGTGVAIGYDGWAQHSKGGIELLRRLDDRSRAEIQSDADRHAELLAKVESLRLDVPTLAAEIVAQTPADATTQATVEAAIWAVLLRIFENRPT